MNRKEKRKAADFVTLDCDTINRIHKILQDDARAAGEFGWLEMQNKCLILCNRISEAKARAITEHQEGER